MSNKKSTKTKKSHPEVKSQQVPSFNSQVSRTVPASYDSLQIPLSEQSEKPLPTQGAVKRQSQHETPKPYRRIDKLNIALTLLFSGVVAVFTGISTYYSSKQWEGVRESIADARETREIENRAYVTAKTIKIRKYPENPRVAQIDVTFVNTGQTPALRTVTYATVLSWKRSVPFPEKPYYPTPEGMPSTPTLASQGEVTISAGPLRMGDNIPTEGLEELPRPIGFPRNFEGPALELKDDEEILVYGFAQYKDIFGRTRLTKYCFVTFPNTWSFRVCETHNSME